jgi:RHS repeat-associated protein
MVDVIQPCYFTTIGSSRFGMYKPSVQEGAQTLGKRNYELSNHLGNVLAVITDNIHMAGDSVWTTVSRTSDYYPFGLDMEGRSLRDTTALATRYGFNGKEKDPSVEWGSATYDYGFRIYNPTIAKFLSVDPLTQSYPELTPYQFASNSPISGIDLDGHEFVLKIYSPILSEKFNKAVNENDIYEQRRITNYALNTKFSSNWVERATKDVGSPAGNSAATLTRDDNVNGVKVVTYGYYNNDINTSKIIPIRSEVWNPSSNGAPDAYYPVDIKEKSFYDANGDFVASYRGGSSIQGYGGSASLIQGYLRGWGYVEYASTGLGYGDDAGASVGSMFGRYKGLDELTPHTLEGRGSQGGFSVMNWGYGTWEGHSEDDKTLWTGTFYSMSMNVSLRSLLENRIKYLTKIKDIGGSIQDTETTLIYPSPRTEKND